ncbi:MAG: PAS domain S-box protein [Xenococcaceae cyanobacterium]
MNNSQQFRHILLIEDTQGRRTIFLEDSTYSIGRASNNSIVISDRQVSRNHAVLLQTKDYKNARNAYWIIDGDFKGNRSSNGITINGRTCSSRQLKDGDLIEFGTQTKAKYYIKSNSSDLDLCQKQSITNERYRKTLFSNKDFKQQLSQEDIVTLASLPEFSPNPIIVIDWEGSITYLNKAATLNFKDLHQAKLEHPLLAGLLTKYKNIQEKFFVREVQIGQEVFKQYVHYLSESKLIRIYVSDCSKSPQIKAELRESEERYRAVFRQTSSGIFLVDAASKRLLEANAAYCNLLGYTESEILGLTLDDIVAGDSEKFESDLQRLKTEKVNFVGESLHRNKDASLINVEVSVSLICYGGKEIFCFFVRDITERKRLASLSKISAKTCHIQMKPLISR